MSERCPIPAAALDDRLAFVGTSGSGKTYAAGTAIALSLILASGGYNWLVIRVDDRAVYLAGLEEASVGGDIAPLARFIAERMSGSAH